jgi:hypothetical protein
MAKDGDQQQTQQVVSGPSNPNVTVAQNKVLAAAGQQLDAGAPFTGAGDTTKNAWALGKASAINPAFDSSLQGALQSYGDTAAGKFIGQNDPGYAAMRAKLSNDVLTATDNSFNNAGLFGSDNNRKEAASGLADSLGALDYQQYNDSLDRQTSAAQLLPQLYSDQQLPAATLGAIGSSEDANTANNNTSRQSQIIALANALNGVAQTSGQTQTTYTPTVPWWQQVAGYVANNAGNALRAA